MQLLSQQVEETNSKATREREFADQLSKQLEEYREAQTAVDDMRAQTSQILKMLSEQHGENGVEQLKSAQVDSNAK